MSGIDLDAIKERRARAERWHEGVHYGLNLYAASSDDVPVLLAELEQAHQRIADLTRERDTARVWAASREYDLRRVEAELERALKVVQAAEAWHDADSIDDVNRAHHGLNAAVDTFREGRDGST